MQEEKKKILKSVQDGKLTAEEALTILDELEKAGKESEQKEQKLKNELSTSVIQGNTKNEEEGYHSQEYFKKNFQATKEKIFDFVESAFQKIKETDLDFNFGKSVEVDHIFQHSETPLYEIDIDIANGKTKIVAWDSHEVRVECQAKVYRVESQEKAREVFVKNVLFSIENGKLTFSIREKAIKVETIIYVPKKEYEDVQMRMFNGGITAEFLRAEKMKVKSANGPLTLQGVVGEICELETGNGAITLQTSQFESIEAETLNGAIQAEGSFNQVDLRTFNGKILCRNTKVDSDMMQARSVTGKIQLFLVPGSSVSGELRSNLGSFQVNMDGIKIVEEQNDVILKILKFQTVQEQIPVTQIFADTKTGAITVS